jgi:hypothetical protein
VISQASGRAVLFQVWQRLSNHERDLLWCYDQIEVYPNMSTEIATCSHGTVDRQTFLLGESQWVKKNPEAAGSNFPKGAMAWY